MPSRSRKRREYKQSRMHEGKRVFDSFEHASRVSIHIMLRSGDRMIAYKCDFCLGYHIGHEHEKTQ